MCLATVRIKYVNIFRDRHGKRRAYFRRDGRNIPLPDPEDPGFHQAYTDALKETQPEPKRPAHAYSFDALAKIYFASPDFIGLREGTQRAYKSTLRAFLRKYGDRSVKTIRFEVVSALMGQMADRPGAANNLLKRLRQLFALAKRLDWIETDPSEGVRYFRAGEIHTWTADEHAAFIKHHQPGTMARLAYMAHLHTGQRKGDIVRLPMPKSASDAFRLAQEKTGKRLEIPLAPALWQEISQHERRPTLIVTSFGKPFTSNGYGNWFRERCREAGLPERCSSHGLRKAAATALAEAGCSAHEIQAITGHESLKEVERYTRAAEQKRLAKSAQAKREENKQLTNPKLGL